MEITDDLILLTCKNLNIIGIINFASTNKRFYNLLINDINKLRDQCNYDKISMFNLMFEMANNTTLTNYSITTYNDLKCSVIPNKIHHLKICYCKNKNVLSKYDNGVIV